MSFTSRQDGQVHTVTPSKTLAFGIYPQLKGDLDYGFQEYFI